MVQDLLENCLSVQAALEQWHVSMHRSTYQTQAAYWISPDQSGAQLPFADVLAFRDALTSLTFLYYWAAQVVFYPCLELLSHALFAPVVDDGVYSSSLLHQQQLQLPPHLQVDPDTYSAYRTREIAAGVCRGLDAALAATAQPDLLAFPVHAVEAFYGGLNAVAPHTGEGAMELLWLVGLRARMMARGQVLAGAAMEKGWRDVAEW